LWRRYIRRIVSPIPRFYGREFGKWRRFLEESQWWAPGKLEDYQHRELEKLIQHSYDNVPYYRDLFREHGLSPRDIQRKEDLKKLPFLTKDLIKANFEQLQAQNMPRSSIEFHTTGGTTGTPLAVGLERRTNAIRLAFDWRFFNWAGYHFGDRCAVVRGRVVEGF